MRKLLLGLIAAPVAFALAFIGFPDEVLTYASGVIPSSIALGLPPVLPKPRPATDAYWLDQNWRLQDRLWMHHATQGTKTFPVPYAWFVALEQPYIFLFSQPKLLSDSEYLQRFGFIPSPKTNANSEELQRFGYHRTSATEPPAIPPSTSLGSSPATNDDGLPVGFARLVTNDKGPSSNDDVGLTCAACHTGHIEYKGKTLRIDGGAGMVDLCRLKKAVGASLVYMLKLQLPGRFDRFADRVLGPNADAASRQAFRKTVTERAEKIQAEELELGQAENPLCDKPNSEGFGRLDALNRIGNQVFFKDLDAPMRKRLRDNLQPVNAPVRFPQIWTMPWLLWAQYDASIEHPLIRNVGEALGVTADLDITSDDPGKIYGSSVVFKNVVWIEDLLRGPDPFALDKPAFRGLAAPKWPETIFADDPAWKIDHEKAAKGRKLYAEFCAGCHLGPVDDPDFDAAFPDKQFWTSKHWIDLGKGEKILATPQKSVDDIATDPARANVLVKRVVQTLPQQGIDPNRDINERWGCGKPLPTFANDDMPFALALMVVVDNVSRKWMADQNISDADRAALIAARKNCPNVAAGSPFYRTRPLNGVWAVAPFLHNGSVPSLYWLLKPAADRPTKFCIGASDYDPRTVGYATPAGGRSDCAIGEFLFSASNDNGPIEGNTNVGHSFQDKLEPGRIGRQLKEDEIFSLIEYVKTL